LTSLVGLGAVSLAGAALAATVAARRSGRLAVAGLILLGSTPLVPFVAIRAGLSLDDILPLAGVLTLIAHHWLTSDGRPSPLAGRVRLPADAALALTTISICLLLVAGLVASITNAADPTTALRMLTRGPARLVFLVGIATLVAWTRPVGWRRAVAARTLAVVGSLEGIFGVGAFLLPLPDRLGLEPARKFSVLYFEVPGRVNGTLGISPNFLGATLLLTLPITVGLALSTPDRRLRLAWWVGSLAQLLAIALSFTRASLGLAVVGLVLLILVRGRLRHLIPAAMVLGIVAWATPLVARIVDDIPDRLALWTSAFRLMIDRPLTGTGPGRMMEVAATNPDRYQLTGFGVATNNAHNTVLLAGAELGVIGALGALLLNIALVLLAVGVLVRSGRPARSPIDTAAAIGVLTFLVQGMTNNLFTVAVTSTMLAFVVGAFLLNDESQDAILSPPSAEGTGVRPELIDRRTRVDGQPH
jgi:hypothetical protein